MVEIIYVFGILLLYNKSNFWGQRQTQKDFEWACVSQIYSKGTRKLLKKKKKKLVNATSPDPDIYVPSILASEFHRSPGFPYVHYLFSLIIQSSSPRVFPFPFYLSGPANRSFLYKF